MWIETTGTIGLRDVSRSAVKRAYRYRFYPGEERAAELSRTLGCVRTVYNRALDARTTARSQEQLGPAIAEIGVGAGPTSPFTFSTGEKISDPRHGQRERVALAKNRRVARAIGDASWSEFRSTLECKAGWYGRTVIAVDRWYPSGKTCSRCGHLLDALPLGVRERTCPGCGDVHDRDVSAAKDILAAGRAVTARGDGVGPNRRWLVGHLSKPPFRGRRNRNCSL